MTENIYECCLKNNFALQLRNKSTNASFVSAFYSRLFEGTAYKGRRFVCVFVRL